MRLLGDFALPVHLRFDESNLYTSLQKLSSPLSFVYASGWCYAYMHAMAESGMFYLQAAAMALGQAPSEITSQRQAQAVDNLGVILQSIGDVGRSAPASEFGGALDMLIELLTHSSSQCSSRSSSSPTGKPTQLKAHLETPSRPLT